MSKHYFEGEIGGFPPEYAETIVYIVGLSGLLKIPCEYEVTSKTQGIFHKMLFDNFKPSRELFYRMFQMMLEEGQFAFEDLDDFEKKFKLIDARYNDTGENE